MIVGDAIIMAGSGSGSEASGYSFEDGVLHIWGVRGSHLLDTKLITEKGIYEAADDGVEGYSIVEVDLELQLQELTATLNGVYTPPEGMSGFSKVTINNPEDGRCQSSTVVPTLDIPDFLSEISWSNTVT